MLIGSKRYEKHENYSEFGLKWVNTIKILGIYFSSSKCASEIELNWQSKILLIKRIISGWEKRNLGILAKICLIKEFSPVTVNIFITSNMLTRKGSKGD